MSEEQVTSTTSVVESTQPSSDSVQQDNNETISTLGNTQSTTSVPEEQETTEVNHSEPSSSTTKSNIPVVLPYTGPIPPPPSTPPPPLSEEEKKREEKLMKVIKHALKNEASSDDMASPTTNNEVQPMVTDSNVSQKEENSGTTNNVDSTKVIPEEASTIVEETTQEQQQPVQLVVSPAVENIGECYIQVQLDMNDNGLIRVQLKTSSVLPCTTPSEDDHHDPNVIHVTEQQQLHPSPILSEMNDERTGTPSPVSPHVSNNNKEGLTSPPSILTHNNLLNTSTAQLQPPHPINFQAMDPFSIEEIDQTQWLLLYNTNSLNNSSRRMFLKSSPIASQATSSQTNSATLAAENSMIIPSGNTKSRSGSVLNGNQNGGVEALNRGSLVKNFFRFLTYGGGK